MQALGIGGLVDAEEQVSRGWFRRKGVVLCNEAYFSTRVAKVHAGLRGMPVVRSTGIEYLADGTTLDDIYRVRRQVFHTNNITWIHDEAHRSQNSCHDARSSVNCASCSEGSAKSIVFRVLR